MRRLETADNLLGESWDGKLVDERIVAGEPIRVEPVECGFDDLRGWNELRGGRARGVDLGSEVLELVSGIAAAGGRGVGRPLVDLRYIAAIVETEAVLSVALDVEDHSQTRADRGVVDGWHTALVMSRVLVVTRAEVEVPVVVQTPAVVHEDRLCGEIRGGRKAEQRIPLEVRTRCRPALGRVQVQENQAV